MKIDRNQTAFADLLERNHARWAGIARAYAPAPDRDDLLQEVLLQIWKSLSSFAGKSQVDTWAYRVALNTALAWDRSAKTRGKKLKVEPSDVGELAANHASGHSDQQVLDEFLQSLSKVDRAVMTVYLDGIENSEAAEVLGMSEGAIRVRLHRIKKKFEERHVEKGVAP